MPASGSLVTGVRVTRYVERTGTTEVPVAGPLSVVVWNGKAFDSVPVTSTDGGFTFTPPTRPYWINSGSRWVVSSVDRIDLSTTVQGGPHQDELNAGDLTVTVSATGLAPWADCELSLATEAVDENVLLFPIDPIAPGATSFDAVRFRYESIFAQPKRLNDTPVVLSQLCTTATADAGTSVDGGLLAASSSTLVASGDWQRVTVPTTAALTVAMKPVVPQAKSVRLNAIQWNQAAALVNPSAGFIKCFAGVTVTTDPSYGAFGVLDELSAASFDQPFSGPVSITWGNPNPASSATPWWPIEFVSCQVGMRQSVGATTGALMTTSISTSDEAAHFPVGDLGVRVTPPEHLTADATDIASAPVTLTTTTPLLEWAAPARGTPNVYVVKVRALVVKGTATTHGPSVWLITTERQLRVPPGVLARGGTYVFEVSAQQLSGGRFDATTAPFSDPLSSDTSGALSSVVTVN